MYDREKSTRGIYMQVSDIISGKIDLKPMQKEKKGSKANINNISENLKSNNRDVISLTKGPAQDMLKLQEMQSTYMKSTTSLDGFNELSAIIEKFEKQPDDQKDWNALSQELKSTITKTLYKGESIISYLSTNVNDEKSLYTLKANLANELQSASARVAQSKKQISRYLVEQANKDAVVGYDPQKILAGVKQDLNQNNVSMLSGTLNHIQRLLNIES